MKQIKTVSLWLLLAMLLPVVSSCSSDDDDPVDLKTYIVGTWSSYKGTVYYLGQTTDVTVDKTGAMSVAYFEMTFRADGSMTIGFWDPEVAASWVEEPATYTVKGDIVTIIDSDGEKGDLVFKDRNLYLKITEMYEGYPMTVNILMKK